MLLTTLSQLGQLSRTMGVFQTFQADGHCVTVRIERQIYAISLLWDGEAIRQTLIKQRGFQISKGQQSPTMGELLTPRLR